VSYSEDIKKILAESHELYKQGFTKLNEANKIIHDGIYKYPKETSLRLALAGHMGSTGTFNDAIEIYKTVLDQNENDHYALTGLGKIYFELGHFQEALQLTQKSLSLNDNPETRVIIATIYLQTRDIKKCELIVLETLKRYPNDPQAKFLKERLEHIKAGDDQVPS